MIAWMMAQQFLPGTEQWVQTILKMFQMHYDALPNVSCIVLSTFVSLTTLALLYEDPSMNLSKANCRLGELLKNLAIALAMSIIFHISGMEADCTIHRFKTCDVQCTKQAFGYWHKILAATPLVAPAIDPAPSYAWPHRFCLSNFQSSILSKIVAASASPYTPFLHSTKPINSSLISVLLSTNRNTIDNCSRFEESVASSAIITEKGPLLFTSSRI